MQCPRCYFENAADARVCEYCGAPLDPDAEGAPVSHSARKRRTQLGTAPDPSTWREDRPSPPRLDPEDPFRLAARAADGDEEAPPRSRRDTLLDEGSHPGQGELAGVLLVLDPGAEPRAVLLRQGRTMLGRDPECDVVIDDPRVSGSHAVLRVEGDRAWILDTSSNGTGLSGRRLLNDRSDLADGAVLDIGGTRLVVKLLSGETLGLLRGESR